jgi:hypothetical protein
VIVSSWGRGERRVLVWEFAFMPRKTKNKGSEVFRDVHVRPSGKIRGQVEPWVVKQREGWMCSRAGKFSNIWAEFCIRRAAWEECSAAAWNLGTSAAFTPEQRKTTDVLDRVGRSRDVWDPLLPHGVQVHERQALCVQVLYFFLYFVQRFSCFFRKAIALIYENQTEHEYIICAKCRFLNVTACGTYSYHCALTG